MNEKLENIIKGLPFTLTEEQDFFLRDFISGQGNACLLGDSGVGKSTIMWILHKYYESSILFGASSGVATVGLPDNIGYATTHKIFNLSVGEAIAKDYKRSCPKILTGSSLITTIVIDEAFCHNSQDLDQILNQIRKLNKATRNRGGRNIRLLFVGDNLQRLPIVEDELKAKLTAKFGHYLMFESNLWKKFNPTMYVFTEVKRQSGESPKDVWFRKALQVIRYGIEKHYDTVLKGLNKLVVGDNFEEGSLYLAPTNNLVNQYNAEYLRKNPNEKITFTADFGPKYDRKEFPMEQKVTLAEGCTILCLVNCPVGTYQNGTELTVTSILNGEGVYGINSEGVEIYLPVHEFKQEEIVAVEKEIRDINLNELMGKLENELSLKSIFELYAEKWDDLEWEEGLTAVQMLSRFSREDLNRYYNKFVKDKILVQERVLIDSAVMLPVKLSAGFVTAKAQGRTFDRKGLIDVGDPDKDYFYTWNKMPDFGVASLFVALGRFTNIDHVQLSRPIDKIHIKTCKTSVDFWFKSLKEFNERRK